MRKAGANLVAVTGSDIPVLIAGGGPAGLTLAISLGQLGVRCEVVDARPAPARVPGAQRCGARAMEIFRRLGVSGRLRDAGLPAEAPLDVLICAGSLDTPLVRHRYPQVAEVLAAGFEVNDGTMPLEPHCGAVAVHPGTPAARGRPRRHQGCRSGSALS